MTHIENIPHILKFGITSKHSNNSNKDFRSIGDESLISKRSCKLVTIDNGDILNPLGDIVKLGDFIPFYFGKKMPMLYVIQNGGNLVKQATPPCDIVYLICPLDEIIKTDDNFVFTDGHATDNFTCFYDKSKINEIFSILDWEAIKTTYWGGEDNLDLKRKKQAEFLVSSDIKPNAIQIFGCYNKVAESALIELGIDKAKITINPDAYFTFIGEDK